MTKHIKILRPVGNTISTTYNPTEADSFSPFHSQFYSSGTASLAAAIVAVKKLKVGINKPEVIVPAYACPDLISAIIYAGAIPVLVDLEIDSPLMSLNETTAAINDRTIAIITIRFFGLQEQFKKLFNIAKTHNIKLIEDSAQGYPSKNLDSYWHGNFIILSFGRGKPLNVLGGGAVLSCEPDLLKKLPIPQPRTDSFKDKIKYELKLFLYNQSIKPLAYGLISRIPGINIGQTIYKPLHAIKGISTFNKHFLYSNIEAYKTRENCQKEYCDILKRCGNKNLIDLPTKLAHDMSQPLLRYPILVKDSLLRKNLYEKLKPFGASLMYKQPLHEIDKVGGHIKQTDKSYPNASHFAQQLITLPTHDGVDVKTIQQIEHILNCTTE